MAVEVWVCFHVICSVGLCVYFYANTMLFLLLLLYSLIQNQVLWCLHTQCLLIFLLCSIMLGNSGSFFFSSTVEWTQGLFTELNSPHTHFKNIETVLLSGSIAQAGLNLLIFLPRPPKTLGLKACAVMPSSFGYLCFPMNFDIVFFYSCEKYWNFDGCCTVSLDCFW